MTSTFERGARGSVGGERKGQTEGSETVRNMRRRTKVGRERRGMRETEGNESRGDDEEMERKSGGEEER